ncbi:DNA-binding SARP family transcriptional activator [Streptomyces sp. Ag109_O5-1]|uniref:AfsR/SARP family transcriptional regulator n=1 Tax=Streptomyces sp. Ag109_O5-1 TaxID=1938851 RepID=UPI000FB69F15|nr:DNA-binding SARP family transcriptional activator [Streptomyces sp. Ag109_O5-1]
MSKDEVVFGVLGPVTAERAGVPLALKGPRHRAVLARLIVARRRVVPVARLVADLWDEPPPTAVGAVRTFVGDLRRALEPDRPPRTPARLLVTDGPGYALRTDAVDARQFEKAVETAATVEPSQAALSLRTALELWRGPAYAEFADEEWAGAERARLAELRLRAVEQRAEALLAGGRAAEAVPDLDAHLTGHPWREEAWRLLALALYRTGRQGDALAVLRRARATLADQLGLDPGPALRRLEAGILAQDPALDAEEAGATAAARVWSRATEAYDRTVAAGARARLESTVGLLRTLAVTGSGGLAAARDHRLAAITAAEEFGDPELTARVIGAYDVPAIWTRSDDPAGAHRIVEAAERALARLPATPAQDAARCRLLATIALESRGTRSARAAEAAAAAEHLARRLDDPALLAFALNGVFMQSCTRPGLAPRRDAIGTELIALSDRHGLATYEVLGHLIRVQARAALTDFPTADAHAETADRLADRHELPLVRVFTEGYRALRLAVTGETGQTDESGGWGGSIPGGAERGGGGAFGGSQADGRGGRGAFGEGRADGRGSGQKKAAGLGGSPVPEAEFPTARGVGGLTLGVGPLVAPAPGVDPPTARAICAANPPPPFGAVAAAYREVDRLLDGPGMPGVRGGLLPLALLCARLAGRPYRIRDAVEPDADWGPYLPWIRPALALAADGERAARDVLRGLPEPPADLVQEALWCVVAAVALELGDRPTLRRCLDRLRPAVGQLAGAGSGLVTAGPVDGWLAAIEEALGSAPKGREAVVDVRLPPRGRDQPRRARGRSTADRGSPDEAPTPRAPS